LAEFAEPFDRGQREIFVRFAKSGSLVFCDLAIDFSTVRAED